MKRVGESVWILVITFLIFDVVSLVGYFIEDESNFVTGKVGYHFASSQLMSLGLLSFVFPFVLGFLFWCRIKFNNLKIGDLKFYIVSVLSVCGFSLAFTSLDYVFQRYLFDCGIKSEIGEFLVINFEHFIGVFGVVVLNILALAFSSLFIYKVGLGGHIKTVKKVKPKGVVKKESKNKGKRQVVTKIPEDNKIVTKLPAIGLLNASESSKFQVTVEQKKRLSDAFEQSLSDFRIEGSVVDVVTGPVVTRLIVDLAAGVKVTSVMNVSNDIARNLKVQSIRVVDVIPGTSSIGIEVPNDQRAMVRFSQIMQSKEYRDNSFELPIAIGLDVVGKPYAFDLAKAPHLLVAGTTGSGKSVGINAMIMSLLYSKTPDELRFIMIDPKMLELSVYSGIPHLYCDVITDMAESFNALKWCVSEMERRYELMSKFGVRNLSSFNDKVRESKNTEHKMFDLDGNAECELLPSIVVVIDEFADLIMSVGKKIEENICRLAQKSRAAGIHLILATQRPSVDVITGLIKSNIPSRMSFQVSSKIDSRTILDQGGAEELLGMGDMLVSIGGSSKLERVHCAFIDDSEVSDVASFLKATGAADYIELASKPAGAIEMNIEGVDEGDLDTYTAALNILENGKNVSISSIQRHLKIGYNRAARIVESLENNGVLVVDEKGNRTARLN